MKTFLQWLGCWILYGLGDVLSRLPYYPYSIYNWCMLTSDELQGRKVGAFWPWNGDTGEDANS